ncbi:glycoside hydrolase family 2 protein [Modestobacter sp. URMC 112]
MPSHPRPQLTRPDWQDLGGAWGFAFDDDDVGLDAHWHLREDVYDHVIRVPFPFESPASGIGDTGVHPVVWYRRVVPATAGPGRRLLLHLGAVDHRAHVWVNGQLVATHEGGSTPFSADVTAALDDSGEQVVVVRAEDHPDDLRQPRGKQDWRSASHAIWYDRTSGIWQPVWLEEVPAHRVEALTWVPDVDATSLDLTVRLAGGGLPGGRLRVVLTRGGDVLADDSWPADRAEVQRRVALRAADPHLVDPELLWSPEHPTLLEARISLLDGDGGVVDEVGSYTALRSVGVAPGGVLLNGRTYFLRLVLAQDFWPESHLAAPDDDALRREVQWAKDLGFNGIRVHQKTEDPRLLAWCDRLGLLVWSELPSAYEFSHQTVDRLTREWLEVLDRDRSHPCVIAWVPFNESWGVPAISRSPQQEHLVRALYHLAKAADPTRLVVANDGWEHPVSDLLTVHDYTARGEVLSERYGDRAAVAHTLAHVQPGHRPVLLPGAEVAGAPLVLSEIGGISFHVADSDDEAGDWGGYGSVRTAEQLLSGYRDLLGAALASPVVAGFCWTQLTDTQQERNGLLTAGRKPKAPVELIRAVTTGLAAAVAADAIGRLPHGDAVHGTPHGDGAPGTPGQRRQGVRIPAPPADERDATADDGPDR